MRKKYFRIASYPLSNVGNAYIDLFFSALKPHNIVSAGKVECNLRWLEKEGKRLDAIHFHWPEKIWRGKPLGRLDKLRHILRFNGVREIMQLTKFLKAAETMGVKKIWTVHNFEHHEGGNWVDKLGYRVLKKNSNLLITHSLWASQKVKEWAGITAKVITINHGNYDGVYPSPRSRNIVIDSLGLKTDLPIISCVGLLRKYKGIEIACEAARLLRGQVQLIVGGMPKPYRDKTYWRNIVLGVPNATLLDKYLTDREFSEIVFISDAILLPYKKITGSGVLLAAWTLGTGIIASNLPFFEEILGDHPDAGVLFNIDDPNDLATSITEYLNVPRVKRRSSALAAAKSFSWDRCVLPFVEEVKCWLQG